jgi:sugar lactone lactonase YvrE
MQRNIITCALLLVLLAGCGGGTEAGSDGAVTEISGVGLMGPSSVVMDTVADVYLVANVNGTPGARDGNGFISLLSPEGEMLSLNWSDPGPAGSELNLHSPSALAIRGDTVLVTDLECVRLFRRTDGQPLARECVTTAEYLSGIDVGPDGSLYVLDSGLGLNDSGELEPTGTDAVYRLVLGEEGRSTTLARGSELGNPSAVAVGTRGIFVATSRTGEIYRVVPGQPRTPVYPATGRRISGIAFLPDGGFAFSSWADGVVFRVTGEGRVERLLENVTSPGALGYDPVRNRLIVPLTAEDRLVFVDLP